MLIFVGFFLIMYAVVIIIQTNGYFFLNFIFGSYFGRLLFVLELLHYKIPYCWDRMRQLLACQSASNNCQSISQLVQTIRVVVAPLVSNTVGSLVSQNVLVAHGKVRFRLRRQFVCEQGLPLRRGNPWRRDLSPILYHPKICLFLFICFYQFSISSPMVCSI